MSLFLPAVCTVTEDQTKTVSGAPSPRFCFVRFLKSFYLFVFCLSRGKEVAARHPALAHVKWAWEFGGIAASPLAASPPARRPREITPPSAAHRARRSREITPPFAAHEPEPAVRGRSRRRSRLPQARRSRLPQARRSREITPAHL